MVDAKSTILKAATPIICATLFLSTIIGGTLQAGMQLHGEHPYVIDNDREPPVILYCPENHEKCTLSDINGGVYLSNYITNMEVNIDKPRDIGDKLYTLCRQFGYTRGIDVDDNAFGYEQSAYQYFFNGHNRYRELSIYHRRILAQCIEAMHQNRNNKTWHNIIDAVLVSLSSHGGHCSWRAEALVNTIYNNLCKFLRENKIGYEPSGDEAKDLMNSMFTILKNDMVEDARNNYLHELMNGDDNWLRREPLDECNHMEQGLRSLLKMGEDFNDVDIPDASRRYFSMVTAKKYLIQKSQRILDQLLESPDREKLFKNIDKEEMNFNDYCRLAGKSAQEIEHLKEKINAVENDDDDDLKQWIRGECALTIDDIAIEIGELFEYNYDTLGCLELTNIFGFKFIVMCFDYSYLESVN